MYRNKFINLKKLILAISSHYLPHLKEKHCPFSRDVLTYCSNISNQKNSHVG